MSVMSWGMPATITTTASSLEKFPYSDQSVACVASRGAQRTRRPSPSDSLANRPSRALGLGPPHDHHRVGDRSRAVVVDDTDPQARAVPAIRLLGRERSGASGKRTCRNEAPGERSRRKPCHRPGIRHSRISASPPNTGIRTPRHQARRRNPPNASATSSRPRWLRSGRSARRTRPGPRRSPCIPPPPRFRSVSRIHRSPRCFSSACRPDRHAAGTGPKIRSRTLN